MKKYDKTECLVLLGGDTSDYNNCIAFQKDITHASDSVECP